MLVLKTLHIWMVISWFAGLFYLPRIYVNLAMVPAESKAERERIAIIDTVFKERPVHVCFQRTADGAVQQKRFNEAARDIDTARLERDYWKRLDQSLATAPPHP